MLTMIKRSSIADVFKDIFKTFYFYSHFEKQPFREVLWKLCSGNLKVKILEKYLQIWRSYLRTWQASNLWLSKTNFTIFDKFFEKCHWMISLLVIKLKASYQYNSFELKAKIMFSVVKIILIFSWFNWNAKVYTIYQIYNIKDILE